MVSSNIDIRAPEMSTLSSVSGNIKCHFLYFKFHWCACTIVDSGGETAHEADPKQSLDA